MILGADSSGYHPTLAQLQAAYAQGVRVWGFYIPGPGIYSGDTQADFDHAHQAEMKSIGWASGNADPAQQKALAASWSVDYPTLDCEGRIRGKGSWTQPWLDTSGFGIYLPYGTDGSIFNGMRAPWWIAADYRGVWPYTDPQATWPGPAPSIPHGLQWAGTVPAFGGEVDRLWLDDFFAGTPAPQSQGAQMAYYMTTTGLGLNDPKLWLCDDLELGPKRAVWNPDEENAYNVNIKDQTVHMVARFVFDRMALKEADALTLAKIDAATQWSINDPANGLVAIKAGLDALKAQVASAPPGSVDLTQVNIKLDRLIAELHAP